MKIIFLCICLLGVFGAGAFAALTENNPQWYLCSKNDDCTVLNTYCQGFIAVNKSFAVVTSNYYLSINSTKDCAQLAPSARPTAVCDDNKCKLIKAIHE